MRPNLAKQTKKRSPKKIQRRDSELWLYLLILLLCAAIVWVVTLKDDNAFTRVEKPISPSTEFASDKTVEALQSRFDFSGSKTDLPLIL